MMLENMIQHVLLALTSLEILTAIGIISSQDEIKYGFDTDCNYKGMETCLPFQTFQIC